MTALNPSPSGAVMDPNLRIAQEFQLEHRHADGSWERLERVEHDAAAHDAERSWLRRAIFRCRACGEEVAVTTCAADDVHEDAAG
jgi:hypothetical protein